MPDLQDVALDTLPEAAAHFAREFQRVLANVQNPNTKAKAKRSVTLTLTVIPTEDRHEAELLIDCTSKLAPHEGSKRLVYMGQRDGELVAVTYDLKQEDMFEDRDPDVHPIGEREAQDG